MITATISFMTTDGENGVGSISDSFSSRRNYAKLSFESNLKNPLFQQLFKRQIRDIQQNGFPSKILGTSKES